MRAGVLVEVGRAIPVQTLAALLDLTLDETQVVIDELRTRAAGVGWDVFTVHRDVAVRAAPPGLDPDSPGLRVDRALIETAWRRDLARRGLTLTQAHLVHGALRGTKAKTLTNDDQVQTGSMVNAGVLARSTSGGSSTPRPPSTRCFWATAGRRRHQFDWRVLVCHPGPSEEDPLGCLESARQG